MFSLQYEARKVIRGTREGHGSSILQERRAKMVKEKPHCRVHNGGILLSVNVGYVVWTRAGIVAKYWSDGDGYMCRGLAPRLPHFLTSGPRHKGGVGMACSPVLVRKETKKEHGKKVCYSSR